MSTVNTKSEKAVLWKCPKCGRQFERRGQSHSCRYFPLEQHYVGKENGKKLFDKFKKEAKKQLGPFKIESLECCIHLVSTFTFAAVRIFRNKIQIDFALKNRIKSKRVKQSVQMSANRYLQYIDIMSEDEIDDELFGWIKEAIDSKRVKAVVV